jgi:hypothetical protein
MMAVLDDHHPVVMMMGMPITMVVTLDHDGFGAGDRRRCDREGGERGNDKTKLLHAILLFKRGGNSAQIAMFRRNLRSFLNSRSAKSNLKSPDEFDFRHARFSTLALLAGTPNSLRQTSAKTATPSRICWCEGLAKHSLKRQPARALSVDHSGPGLIATPAASAA